MKCPCRRRNHSAANPRVGNVATQGVLTACYGNPRQLFVSGTVKF